MRPPYQNKSFIYLSIYHQADIRMRSHRLLRLDNIKSAASCELQIWCKLWTAGLMQVVNCRLDASCELRACCKLRAAGLMQVVNCRLDASCEPQTWCKLWTAGLMQVVNCRLDASCHLQTWCKLSKGWVRKAPYEASCIHYFEQKTAKQVALFRL